MKTRLLLSSILVGALFVGCFKDSDSGNKENPVSEGTLELVWVRLDPSTNILNEGAFSYLSKKELSTLQEFGLHGRLIEHGIARQPQGAKNARMVVIMHKNVVAPIDIPQPDGTNAIYIQRENAFETIPKSFQTNGGVVRLEPTLLPSDGNATSYSVDLGIGRQGGTAFIWRDRPGG